MSSDIQHLEATLQGQQTEIDQLTASAAGRTAEFEKLKDVLQTTAAENARLESRISDLEDNLANRSTETEAQHRQEEVFQLKDDLEAAQRDKRKMQATERQQMDEIEAKQAEIADLQAKVEQLEQSIEALTAQLVEAKATPPIEVNIAPSPAVEPSHVQLLHAKIERLRVERDELQQTMSFVKHEHRFALQASEADKASTAEKLQKAQHEVKHKEGELSRKLAELEGMQKRITDTGAELEDLRCRLSAQTTSRVDTDELTGKIGQLESALAEVQAERTGLRSEVDQLTRVRDAAVCDLDAFRSQSADAIQRQAKLEREIKQLRLERDEAGDFVTPSTPVTPIVRSPVEAAFSTERRPLLSMSMNETGRQPNGHLRRQSLHDMQKIQPQVGDPQAQIKVLEGKIQEAEDKSKSLQQQLNAEISRKEAEVARVQRRERKSSLAFAFQPI